ncbi:hypothetical protein HYH02_015348 [Chlamydomonas schloesseri]|nr:hypothetical protein HYH02_015348 [Chlamydomonas schloesseri]|eukprot:KAG2423320.1 hypothetical protein HYH02_015348 [Chlamydomonas schloesseri]
MADQGGAGPSRPPRLASSAKGPQRGRDADEEERDATCDAKRKQSLEVLKKYQEQRRQQLQAQLAQLEQAEWAAALAVDDAALAGGGEPAQGLDTSGATSGGAAGAAAAATAVGGAGAAAAQLPLQQAGSDPSVRGNQREASHDSSSVNVQQLRAPPR